MRSFLLRFKTEKESKINDVTLIKGILIILTINSGVKKPTNFFEKSNLNTAKYVTSRNKKNTLEIIMIKFLGKVVGIISKKIDEAAKTVKKSINLSRKTQIIDFPKLSSYFVLRYTPLPKSPALIGIKKFKSIAAPFKNTKSQRGIFLISERKTFSLTALMNGEANKQKNAGRRKIKLASDNFCNI